jgi:TM2 domain-containing membrane protein YozV
MAEEKQGPSRVVVGIVAIFLGGLGIHKFMLGQTMPGVILLLMYTVGCLLVGLGPLAAVTIGVIEGIIYLTKTDEQFYQTYVVEKKAWF